MPTAMVRYLCKNYIKKSECMIFQAKGRYLSTISVIKCYRIPLKRVEHFKYLGHVVSSDLKGNADIERERKALSVRANMLPRRFALND